MRGRSLLIDSGDMVVAGEKVESTAARAAQLRTYVKDGELHEEALNLLGDERVLRAANESEPTLLQLAAINGRVTVAEELLTRGVASVDDVCR
eukprot:COSAG02_NODE_28410_length_590_cov_0.790224_1_plen_92_part_10